MLFILKYRIAYPMAVWHPHTVRFLYVIATELFDDDNVDEEAVGDESSACAEDGGSIRCHPLGRT